MLNAKRLTDWFASVVRFPVIPQKLAACGFFSMTAFNFAEISSMASSQLICSNWPEPRSPVRLMGCRMRAFSSCTFSTNAMQRAQALLLPGRLGSGPGSTPMILPSLILPCR